MTLQPQDTVYVACAVFPKGNVYMQMRDALGPIYQDEAFAHLFPQNGRPVEARLPTGTDYCHAIC